MSELEQVIEGAAEAIRAGVKPVTPPASYVPVSFTEPCKACGGSGTFRSWSGRAVGPCFKCKGAGKKVFKTSGPTRAKAKFARMVASEKRENEAAEAVAAWKVEHPAVWQWMEGSTFPFAVSLRESLIKWGSLTEKQLAAAQKCVAKLAAVREEKIAAAPAVEVSALEQAFEAAAKSGLKKIALRVAGIKIEPAKKYPGTLYAKAGSQYLGKITGGKFFAVRECSEEQKAKVVEVVSNPEAAAKAYGIETGQCSCCGRELTVKASIEAGIGPICAAKYGWG